MDLNYLDTHMHLIEHGRFGYEWTSEIDRLSDGLFGLKEYEAQWPVGCSRSSIFMETATDEADYQQEAYYVQNLMQQEGSGIAGVIASCRPEDPDQFDPWLEKCAESGITGFRRVLHTEADELSQSDRFRTSIRRLGDHGKTFDICVLERQLHLAELLARACPNTTFILDHCGVPDIAGGGFREWNSAIASLAKLDNVHCKLSGLLAYCSPEDRSISAIFPYFEQTLEAFGCARLVWGSDWPVVELGGGLEHWLDVTGALLGALTNEEARSIAADNAIRIYNLKVGNEPARQ